MALALRQEKTQKNKVSQSPYLIKSIGLLELSKQEVRSVIRSELEANPMIEIDEQESEDAYLDELGKDILQTDGAGTTDKGEDWDSYWSNNDEGWPDHVDQEKKLSPYERATALYSGALQTRLHWQLNLGNFNVVQKEIGIHVIGNLDEDGYLTLSAEELCQSMKKYLPETVKEVIKIIQKFDPPGIAAKDHQECLLIQARGAKKLSGTVCETILKDHWKDLQEKRWEDISKSLGIPLAKVKLAISAIASNLFPRPARYLERRKNGVTLSAFQIDPDLYIYEDGHQYRIEPSNEYMPIRINRYYNKLLESEKGLSEKDRDYLQEKKRRAESFINSLAIRHKTIWRLTQSVIKHQRTFFDSGFFVDLRPLISDDIAAELNLDPSTVRRARKNKYVDTPHGVFALGFFFDKVGIDTLSGKRIASKGIKEVIKNLIDFEDKKNPFSDQELTDILQERHKVGIDRRVVTKYRDTLGFQVARLRREPF